MYKATWKVDENDEGNVRLCSPISVLLVDQGFFIYIFYILQLKVVLLSQLENITLKDLVFVITCRFCSGVFLLCIVQLGSVSMPGTRQISVQSQESTHKQFFIVQYAPQYFIKVFTLFHRLGLDSIKFKHIMSLATCLCSSHLPR